MQKHVKILNKAKSIFLNIVKTVSKRIKTDIVSKIRKRSGKGSAPLQDLDSLGAKLSHLGRLIGKRIQKQVEVMNKVMSIFLNIVKTVSERIKTDIVSKIQKRSGKGSAALQDLDNLDAKLSQRKQDSTPVRGDKVTIQPEYLPSLMLAIQEEQLWQAKQIEEKRQKESNPDVSKKLKEKLEEYNQLMALEWLDDIKAATPRLTDALTNEAAEEAISGEPLPERQYDEKFHILQAPGLFSSDLTRYRTECGMRDLSIIVALMDIDNFKKFNTDYTFPIVDIHLLPKFMTLLEAHVFGRGFAYRYDGDEYVVLLPNAEANHGRQIMEEFQNKLKNISYVAISENPTVSIGIYEVKPDCFLTNDEIYLKAEEAKNQAKNEKGTIVLSDVN